MEAHLSIQKKEMEQRSWHNVREKKCKQMGRMGILTQDVRGRNFKAGV